MAGIDIATPYRDPRTAFGQRIPVGSATEMAGSAADDVIRGVAPAAGEQPQASRAGRFAQSRAGLNAAVPSRDIGALGKTGGAIVRGVGKASPYLAVAGEGYSTALDTLTPGMTPLDNVARVAEGTGRLAGAGVGAMAGGSAGAALGPVGAAAGSILGGAAGYFAPDAVNSVVNWATGNDTKLASDKAAALRAANPQPAATVRPALPTSAPAASFSDARQGPPVTAMNIAAVEQPAGAPTRGSAAVAPTFDPAAAERTSAIEARNSELRRELDAYGPGAGGGGGAVGIGGDPARSDRNLNFDRSTALSRLESASRLGSTSGARREALGMYAQLSGQPLPSEVARSVDQANQTARRGQDINLTNAQINSGKETDRERMRARSSMDIANLQGKTQRDVANIGADARVTAAEARAERQGKRYLVVGGGARTVDDGMGGLKTVQEPQQVFDQETGQMVNQPPAQQSQYTTGQTYINDKGDKATWDGTKFVPSK